MVYGHFDEDYRDEFGDVVCCPDGTCERHEEAKREQVAELAEAVFTAMGARDWEWVTL